jgi:hypothetical protein
MILLPGRHSGWARRSHSKQPKRPRKLAAWNTDARVQPAAIGDQYGAAQRQKNLDRKS